MFGFQPLHLIVVFVIALIVFGPQKLPEIGRMVGKAVIEFRNGTRELTESFNQEINPSTPPRPVSPAAQTSLYSGAAPAAGNFCIQCGAPNPSEARFCNQCGAQIPGKTVEPPPAVDPPVEQSSAADESAPTA